MAAAKLAVIVNATALLKLHGLGNDFLVVANPSEEIGDEHARAWCDRHTGIGADGLLVLRSGGRAGADLDMRLINAHGGTAEMSGNGIRCLVHAAYVEKLVDGDRVSVDTDAGRREVVVVAGDTATQLWQRVDMGVARDGGPLPSVVERLVPGARVAALDMGNPHVIVGLDHVDVVTAFDLAAVGAAIENAVPGGVNVSVIAASSDDAIRSRVWERGVGLTQACGTGACAAAVAATRWGWVQGRVRVQQPGGDAVVHVGARVELEGPTVLVARCEAFVVVAATGS